MATRPRRLWAGLVLVLCPPAVADPPWISGEWRLSWDDRRDGSFSEQHAVRLSIEAAGGELTARSVDLGGETTFRGRTWTARGVTLVTLTQIGPDFYRVFSGAAAGRDLLEGTYYGVDDGPPGSSGEWRLERFSFSGIEEAGDLYLGCYRDQRSGNGTAGRDLAAAAWNDPGMTSRLCIDFCRSQGFAYAGTQYASWCFCGESYGRLGKADGCDMPCAGDRQQACGGEWANSVYQVGLAGAAARPAADPCAAAVATVHAWAHAWSRQDARSYLAYYGREFLPPAGLTREVWEAQRRQRIERPEYVGVRVMMPEVVACDNRRATVTFLQVYTSDAYRDRIRKELRLERSGYRWQIVGERSAGFAG